MSTLTYTVPDAEFDDGELAQGSEVRTRFTDISGFLNGGNIDGTNLDLTATLAWAGLHSYSVSSSSSHNLSLIVNSVLDANIYGFRIYSNAAQINSPLVFIHQDNASSTAAVASITNDGTGASLAITQNGIGNGVSSSIVGTANTGNCVSASQAGTGEAYSASIRSLSGLNAVLLKSVATSTTTIDNTATETEFNDLTVTLPADFLQIGTTIRGKVYGSINTPGASPATMRVLVRYGGTSGTILLDTGAFTPDVDLVDSALEVDFIITCRTIGATGTVFAQGITKWNDNAIPDNRGMGTAGTGAANSSAITIDTTGANDLVVTFVWGTAVSGCTANLQVGSIEVLK